MGPGPPAARNAHILTWDMKGNRQFIDPLRTSGFWPFRLGAVRRVRRVVEIMIFLRISNVFSRFCFSPWSSRAPLRLFLHRWDGFAGLLCCARQRSPVEGPPGTGRLRFAPRFANAGAANILELLLAYLSRVDVHEALCQLLSKSRPSSTKSVASLNVPDRSDSPPPSVDLCRPDAHWRMLKAGCIGALLVP